MRVSAKLISETFDVLSVTVWLLDEENGQLVVGASTARPPAARPAARCRADTASSAVAAGLRARSSPFDLEDVNEPWAEELRQLNPTTFPNGGNRLCVPLARRGTEPWRRSCWRIASMARSTRSRNWSC